MAKHLPLPINARHFDRWLALFEAAARDLCPPKAAEHFVTLARRIADSLELGVAGAHGVLLRKGERFLRVEQPGFQGQIAGRRRPASRRGARYRTLWFHFA